MYGSSETMGQVHLSHTKQMTKELIEGYEKIIVESDRDKESPRWCIYKEKVKEVHYELHSKNIKKRVHKRIETIWKETCMSREKYKETIGIYLEMSASGKSNILMDKPLVVDTRLAQGVTIVGSSTSAPYAIVSQIQPQFVPFVQNQKDEEDVSIIKVQIITLPRTRSHMRLTKVNEEPTESPTHKRTKKMASGPRKNSKIIHGTQRRKTWIIESKLEELEKEEANVKHVEEVKVQVKVPTRRKPYKPKIETLNNTIIDNDSFA